MSLKYTNYKRFIEERSGRVLSAPEAADAAKEISFECAARRHQRCLKYTSFANFKVKVIKEGSAAMCPFCAKEEQVNERARRTLEACGHQFVAAADLKNIKYICGNCSRENTTNIGALEKPSRTRFCNGCQNEARGTRNDSRVIETELAARGVEVQEYKNNKNVRAVCTCGKEFTTTLLRLRGGSKCAECANDRRAATNMERYGAPNPFGSEQIKEKIKETCKEKYGVTHHMQCREIVRKSLVSSYQRRAYTFPSGKLVYIMGYEQRALDLLLLSYDEKELEVEEIPVIRYSFEGRECAYHADIFIENERRLIEVKSTYTLELERDRNMAKFHAAVASGFSLRLLVFSAKGSAPVQDTLFQ